MKNKFFLLLLSFSLLVPVSVLAAGSGGGGSIFVETPPAQTTPTPAPTPASAATPTPAVAPAPAPAPAASTPAPIVKTLKCNQEAMRDRIQCRLGLTEEEMAAELEIQYLPEECRAVSGITQVTCIERYKALRPCWEKPVGVNRSACARKVLGVGSSASAALRACTLKKNRKERANCVLTAKDKIYALIKFRLYDLSERAEALLHSGKADAESVTALVNAMETTKQKFNLATTYAARRALLVGARSEWKKFVLKFKGKISAADYLDQALADLQIVK